MRIAEWRWLQLTQGVVSDMAIDEELSQFEYWRRRDHHDVLCLVLKEMLRAATARRIAGNPPLNANFDDTMAGLVEIAERLADLAYPPPKGRL
jgi:hypothetical protein